MKTGETLSRRRWSCWYLLCCILDFMVILYAQTVSTCSSKVSHIYVYTIIKCLFKCQGIFSCMLLLYMYIYISIGPWQVAIYFFIRCTHTVSV